MTNDTQVEVWRNEFEKWFLGDSPTSSLHKHNDGTYAYATAQNAWGVWCAAKRSMQPIELPDIEDCWVDNHENYYCAIKYENKIKAMLTAAGYSYRVKE